MKCRECKQEVIYVINNNENVTINFNSTTDEDLVNLAQGKRVYYQLGIHMPHWVTCTNPQFGKENDSTPQ